ncbi:efflux RND transporter periplasmic adaptor subunit [Sphingomonas sp.]|uniref:efflux RND transporter periplasmic adaptor subunit n=1 Tax=Sphingomonas sp. TaxID=28214 RepID=UPI001DA1D89B|nr:efflux RND transporter periplasmic adaptor subunit [Sphingomonas sp.]MBX9797409.1 efflux RND transporter periplasmic adaptor subunit [Sphingomonas sp.]
MNYETGVMGNDARLLTGEAGATARPRRTLWLVGAAAAVALAGGAWYATSHGSAKSDPLDNGNKQQVPSVTVEIPGKRLIDREIAATGSLAARVDMPVGVAGEGGEVTQVLVQPGDWVRAGQVLATIDRSVQVQTQESLAASIAVSRADARLAQAELDRAQQLVDRGFISKADLDRRTATRDAALARVKVAEAQLSETRARTGRLFVRAPAAGLVLTRSVEPGQVVSAGSGTLFRLAKDGELEMRALLSDTDLLQLRTGARAQVTPVGDTRVFSGRVWQISPVIDPQTRQGVARIALSYDTSLRPGGFAAARITSGTSEAPLVPQSAVQSDDKGNYLYIVGAKNQIERRDIKTGPVSDAGVAVLNGLSGNEQVVMLAGAFLNPGQKVVPVRRKKQG